MLRTVTDDDNHKKQIKDKENDEVKENSGDKVDDDNIND